jgi:hypothetical protein
MTTVTQWVRARDIDGITVGLCASALSGVFFAVRYVLNGDPIAQTASFLLAGVTLFLIGYRMGTASTAR